MPKFAQVFIESFWIVLRRVGRDRRARSALFKLSLALLSVVGYPAYIVYTCVIGGRWQGVFYAFIFGTGAMAAILMRRWHRKQDEILNYSLTSKVNPSSNGVFNLSPSVRTYLEDRALIIASLLARGASEVQIHQKLNHEAGGVLARQILNGFLREHGLWTKLEPAEVDLASVADGLWTSSQEGCVVTWCEQLRLLRWALGVDPQIVPLWHCPNLDFRVSQDLLHEGGIVRGRSSQVGPWDIRMQRDVAVEYTARIAAELKVRGTAPTLADVAGWAEELRAKSLGDSVDLVAGARTVAEMTEDGLRLLGSLAIAREQYASFLIEQSGANEPLVFSSWQVARAEQLRPQ